MALGDIDLNYCDPNIHTVIMSVKRSWEVKMKGWMVGSSGRRCVSPTSVYHFGKLILV